MSGLQGLQAAIQRAVSLEKAHRLEDAAAVYEAILAQSADLPNCWYNLAVLQRRLGRFEAALASYQQALKWGIPQPEEVHLNRGVIYTDYLRDDEAAERELKSALARNPVYAPALLNLANLKEDQGDRPAALLHYQRLLAVAPEYFEGLARYAILISATQPTDAIVGRLQRAIANPKASPADQASLSFALGKILDRCGAYDEAFAAFQAANRFSRAASHASVAPYNRAQHEKLVDELISTFAQVPKSDPVPAGGLAPPIFVCGMFRSGSTLVEQVLASHPLVTAGGELDLLPVMARLEISPFPSAMAQLSAARLSELASIYMQSIEKLFPGAGRITDKRPDNFLYLGLIKSLFPAAKIVHTTRDALDNCLSIFFLHLDHTMAYAFDLEDTAHYLRQHDRLMTHWKSIFGADILDFNYDEFVRAPRPSTERLLAFCGLKWNDACLTFHETKNAVKTASVWQVREPLYQRSSGRWRHYAKHLTQLRSYLGTGES